MQITLPASCTTAYAQTLHQLLLSEEAPYLDCREVTRLSMPCLQLLIAGAREKKIALLNAPEMVVKAVALLGHTNLFQWETPHV